MDATTPHAEPRPSRVRYVVLAWLCAAAMIAYVARNSISAAESSIRTSLNLTEWEMGIALGAFFLPYALLQVPTGWLSHIWGSRLALPLFSLLGSVMTGVFAWAGGFYTLTIGRFGMGVAQAGLFPAATSTGAVSTLAMATACSDSCRIGAPPAAPCSPPAGIRFEVQPERKPPKFPVPLSPARSKKAPTPRCGRTQAIRTTIR